MCQRSLFTSCTSMFNLGITLNPDNGVFAKIQHNALNNNFANLHLFKHIHLKALSSVVQTLRNNA